MPFVDFVTGVKRTVIEPGEIIREIRVPRLDGPQPVPRPPSLPSVSVVQPDELAGRPGRGLAAQRLLPDVR